MAKSYLEVRNDAGLLREWLAEKYGDAFGIRGSCFVPFAARTAALRLSRLTGDELLLIKATAANDWVELQGGVAAGFRVFSSLHGFVTCLATLPSIGDLAEYLNQNPGLNRAYLYVEVMI